METVAVNLRLSPHDVYVGRAGKGQDGYFGNPIKVGERCPRCDGMHMEGSATLPCYLAYLTDRIAADDTFRERVKSLRGKRLGCFCKPKPCHADILAAFADQLNR